MHHSKKFSKGFGTIEFTQNTSVQAILNAELFYGSRRIICQPYLRGGDLFEKQANVAQNRIYIKGIPQGMTDQQLYNLFESTYSIESAFRVRTRGIEKDYGYVTFLDQKDKRLCLKKAKILLPNGAYIKCVNFNKKIKKGQTATDKNRSSKRRIKKKNLLLKDKKESMSEEGDGEEEITPPSIIAEIEDNTSDLPPRFTTASQEAERHKFKPTQQAYHEELKRYHTQDDIRINNQINRVTEIRAQLLLNYIETKYSVKRMRFGVKYGMESDYL